ncbi:MAG: membrane protein [Bacteroidetes bacterium]|nr:MAG: membrane protein [Bacteroidota bacterium]
MPRFLPKEKIFTSNWLRSYAYILIGTLIMAAGYVFFIIPYKIIPGGIYGISIVFHHLLHTPIGLLALAFNIPLTILGTRILGPRFGIKTVVGFVLAAFFIDMLNWFSGGKPLVEDDPLLSSIFGGVLIGIGVGLFFKSKATTGGSDVISMILGKYSRIPLGQLMIIVDSVIVLFGFLAFRDWKIPLYSWIVIFIMGKVIDMVLEGVSYERSVTIVSDKNMEIAEVIKSTVKRGGTIISGRGIYQGMERSVLLTVLNRRELTILLHHIKAIDPNAFVTVVGANMILGEGFRSLERFDEE